MDHVIYLYAAAVVLAVALAGIAVWSPRATRIKVVALTLTALIMPTAYASLMDLLGKPKPVTMEWAKRAVAEATVLGASMHEDQAIYLWLQLDDAAAPRAYVLPWDLAAAKGLQQAMRRADGASRKPPCSAPACTKTRRSTSGCSSTTPPRRAPMSCHGTWRPPRGCIGKLGVAERDPAQLAEQHVSHRREPQAQLVGLHGRADEAGTSVRMRRPFDAEAERTEPLFYAEPQPALPPKRPNAG